MAWRILQFGALFAIGYTLESNPDSAFGSKVLDTPNIDLSLKLIDPQDVIVQKEQSALFQCQTESRKGQVQITWFHNDVKITENDSNRIIHDNGDLFIPKVISVKNSSEDFVGEYRCQAKNRVGALLSNVAKLKIASMEKEFSINPDNSTVYLDQPTIFRCGIHSTTPVDIQWEFNNESILPHQTRYVPLPNGVLLIQKSQSSDNGTLRCKATNYILNKTKYSKIAYLAVLPKLPDATVPSFLPLDISPNVTVQYGEKLTLYCTVMGWPIPAVQWLNNDNIVIGNNSILEVPDVKGTDAGNYICTAYNNLGRINKTFTVLVRQKPVFTVRPISKLYPAAITARLDCRATGIPEPKIVWLKDGQPLKFDSRVRKQANRLIFSHIFTNDSGMYQCIASNAAGRVWTAVQIDIINTSQTPQPPQNLTCRPYNSSTICLNWKAPINVSVTGYSVHSFYNDHGVEKLGPDYARNVTSMEVTGLKMGTDYTFYVCLYSTVASDPSEKVTCKPGKTGNRSLQIERYTDNTSVILKWSEISTDISCTGEMFPYKVQWKTDWPVHSSHTRKKYFVIPDLLPGVEYKFRVLSSNKESQQLSSWLSYFIPDLSNSSHLNGIEDNTTSRDTRPQPPSQITAIAVSSSVIKLSWTSTDKSSKFFMVCYKIVDKESVSDTGSCEEGNFLNSSSNKVRARKLKSRTMYEFKIRAHNSEGTPGDFSDPVYATTKADVPSAVTDLKYKVLNDSTVHLRWHKPKQIGSNKIQKYIVSYSPDLNIPLEKWPNVTVSSNVDHLSEESMVLGNLNFTTHYTVLVMAVSDIGIGKPATLDITTSIKIAEPEISTTDISITDISITDIKYNQKVGYIVGTIIALLCIMCCISFILVRRKCVKRRTLARSRMMSSNNYCPGVAHYATQVEAVQVRLEDTCNADEQESQFLVAERTTNIPVIESDHLDTKGGEEFPNGHTNGSARPYMNGHVHITENPQYYAFNYNDQMSNKSEKFEPLRFEEDSNSNVKSSKFYDLHRLFENSKKLKSSVHHQCNPHFGGQNEDIRSSFDEVHSSESSRDISLNGTQTTCLNDSLNASDLSRRKSPILGPNG